MTKEWKVWDEYRINRLIRLYVEGRTFSQIAKDLKVTRSTIAGKAMRLGLSRDNLKALQREHVMEERKKMLLEWISRKKSVT